MDKLELEDALNAAGVFYNGRRGEEHKAHIDSYMTCINWKKLDTAWETVKDYNPAEHWTVIAKEFSRNAYLSPNQGIIGDYILRKVGGTGGESPQAVTKMLKLRVLEKTFNVPKSFVKLPINVRAAIGNHMYGGLSYDEAVKKQQKGA